MATEIPNHFLYNMDYNDLDTLYFFSDLRGNLPFCLDPHYPDGDSMREFQKLLGCNGLPLGTPAETSSLSLDVHNPLALTQDLPEGKGLCFLGNVEDGGPYSVQLLYSMLQLKSENPKRVILLLGERDLKKLMFAEELALVYRPPGSDKTNCVFCQDEVAAAVKGGSFLELLRVVLRLFSTRDKSGIGFASSPAQLAQHLDYLGIQPHKTHLSQMDQSAFIRLQQLYGKAYDLEETLEPQWNLLREFGVQTDTEGFTSLYKLTENTENFTTEHQNEARSLAVCLITMLMSNQWKSPSMNNESLLKIDLVTESDIPIASLNGIYPRYVAMANTAVKIQMDGRLYYASHGGLDGKIYTLDRCDDGNSHLHCIQPSQNQKGTARRDSTDPLSHQHINLWKDGKTGLSITEAFTVTTPEFPSDSRDTRRARRRWFRKALELTANNPYSSILEKSELTASGTTLWDQLLSQETHGGSKSKSKSKKDKGRKKSKQNQDVDELEDKANQPQGSLWRATVKGKRGTYNAVDPLTLELETQDAGVMAAAGYYPVHSNIYAGPAEQTGRVWGKDTEPRTRWVQLNTATAPEDTSFSVYRIRRGEGDHLFGRAKEDGNLRRYTYDVEVDQIMNKSPESFPDLIWGEEEGADIGAAEVQQLHDEVRVGSQEGDVPEEIGEHENEQELDEKEEEHELDEQDEEEHELDEQDEEEHELDEQEGQELEESQIRKWHATPPPHHPGYRVVSRCQPKTNPLSSHCHSDSRRHYCEHHKTRSGISKTGRGYRFPAHWRLQRQHYRKPSECREAGTAQYRYRPSSNYSFGPTQIFGGGLHEMDDGTDTYYIRLYDDLEYTLPYVYTQGLGLNNDQTAELFYHYGMEPLFKQYDTLTSGWRNWQREHYPNGLETGDLLLTRIKNPEYDRVVQEALRTKVKQLEKDKIKVEQNIRDTDSELRRLAKSIRDADETVSDAEFENLNKEEAITFMEVRSRSEDYESVLSRYNDAVKESESYFRRFYIDKTEEDLRREAPQRDRINQQALRDILDFLESNLSEQGQHQFVEQIGKGDPLIHYDLHISAYEVAMREVREKTRYADNFGQRLGKIPYTDIPVTKSMLPKKAQTKLDSEGDSEEYEVLENKLLTRYEVDWWKLHYSDAEEKHQKDLEYLRETYGINFR